MNEEKKGDPGRDPDLNKTQNSNTKHAENLYQSSSFVLHPKYHDEAGHCWKAIPGPFYHLTDSEIISESIGYLLNHPKDLTENEYNVLQSINSRGVDGLSERLIVSEVALFHEELWLSSELDHLQRIRKETKKELGKERFWEALEAAHNVYGLSAESAASIVRRENYYGFQR